MNGNDGKVFLDLNFPEFQSELFEMDAAEIKKTFKTFKKIRSSSWNDIFRDNGLNSQSYRAVAVRDGTFMRFQSLHKDHDGAYGKK